MAKKDLASKKIEDYNEVFADIYNTLLFQKKILDPGQLGAGPTESIYRTDQKDMNEQRRDILKKYRSETHLLISSLGIENQAEIDQRMPVRVMGYDFGTYRQQLMDQEKKLTPVITIVLNMSDKKWQAAKSLHEMLDIDMGLKEYVQDYKIHVFDIAFLEDEVIESFTSDFKEIASFFKKRRLGEDPLASNRELDHPRAVMEFISAFTRDERYLEGMQYLENARRKGGAITMCHVVDELIAKGERQGMLKGRREGKREGILYGKVELLSEMHFPIARIAERLGISQEQVKEILHQN